MTISLYLLLVEEEENKPHHEHVHANAPLRGWRIKPKAFTFQEILNQEGKQQKQMDCYISWVALKSPKESLLIKLNETSYNQVLITLTCFDHATFLELDIIFDPVFVALTKYPCNENKSSLKLNRTKGGPSWFVDSKMDLAIFVLDLNPTCCLYAVYVFVVSGFTLKYWLRFFWLPLFETCFLWSWYCRNCCGRCCWNQNMEGSRSY